MLLLLLASACSGTAPAEGGAAAWGPCPPSPNCVWSLSADPAVAVEPYPLRPDTSWQAVVAVVAAMPRTRVVSDEPGRLQAEATSRLFRFVDDLALRRRSDGRTVDVRSASRVGHSDLGVNRRRVEALRGALREAGLLAE